MLPGLDGLLSKLEGFFGKSYLVSGFGPTLVFVGLSVPLALHIERDRVMEVLAAVGAEEQTLDKLLYWVLALLVVAFVGFVLWTLNPWMREVLEGRRLPKAMQNELTQAQRQERDKLIAEKEEVADKLFDWTRAIGIEPAVAVRSPEDRDCAAQWSVRLLAARKEGAKLPASRGGTVVGAIRGRLEDLEARDARGDSVPFEACKQVFKMLEQELKTKPVDKAVGEGPLRELGRLQHRFLRLSRRVLSTIEGRYRALSSRLAARFPSAGGTLGCNRLANMAELVRDYAEQRYGMDFDIFWVRLQPIVAEDEQLRPLIDQAKTQLDISVAMSWLSLLYAALWGSLLLWKGDSFALFAAVITVAPLAALLSYMMAVAAYRALGEGMRAAIDLKRLTLMSRLRVQVPGDTAKEKALWEQLSEHAQLRGRGEITIAESVDQLPEDVE